MDILQNKIMKNTHTIKQMDNNLIHEIVKGLAIIKHEIKQLIQEFQ